MKGARPSFCFHARGEGISIVSGSLYGKNDPWRKWVCHIRKGPPRQNYNPQKKGQHVCRGGGEKVDLLRKKKEEGGGKNAEKVMLSALVGRGTSLCFVEIRVLYQRKKWGRGVGGAGLAVLRGRS